VRYDSPSGVALIAQLLKGRTQATADPTYTWRYRAWFALVAKDLGRHRFAVRYDDFGSHQDENLSPGPWLRDEGDALTFGWTWAAREHVEIAAEWLRIDSNYNGRGRIGESPRAIEHLVQLAVRLSL
jgi:hypothetical protein